MTIKIEVTCDALGCFTSDEIDEDLNFEDEGYHEYLRFHYCKKCWDEIKKENDGSN